MIKKGYIRFISLVDSNFLILDSVGWPILLKLIVTLENFELTVV